ncbi:MAG: UDP-N-acetylmuramoyl-tripeptide--D-alanyl-D-alanine ligase, partial [Oscillospiraceae bacterium]|nr:UDP-N-acetylmuramoyl-tripeptide--D-alanyl-D-alanine ligase [Oscillospiraceae bacterium]
MFTTEEAAQITGGTLFGDNVTVSAVSTDTRTIKPGDLFIVIRGESFDGNEFIAA